MNNTNRFYSRVITLLVGFLITSSLPIFARHDTALRSFDVSQLIKHQDEFPYNKLEESFCDEASDSRQFNLEIPIEQEMLIRKSSVEFGSKIKDFLMRHRSIVTALGTTGAILFAASLYDPSLASVFAKNIASGTAFGSITGSALTVLTFCWQRLNRFSTIDNGCEGCKKPTEIFINGTLVAAAFGGLRGAADVALNCCGVPLPAGGLLVDATAKAVVAGGFVGGVQGLVNGSAVKESCIGAAVSGVCALGKQAINAIFP